MYFSICAIVKNETPYLEEWINFHRAVGAEHFYIYDNESTIPVKQTLEKYIKADLVTVIDYPGKGLQMRAYGHCIRTYGRQNRWVGIIDADEFILPKVKDTVPEILENYEAFGGLAVNWIIYGSNGHRTKPDGLLIENYTMASAKSMKHNNHVKSIVQPAYVLSEAGDPHHMIYRPPHFAVAENHSFVKQAWTENTTRLIQINHYFTKSYEEFEIKCQRG